MNNLDEISNKQNYIFDVNENDFVEKVIDGSNNKTILVDFWATWCGPCKQLSPVLEGVINKCNGKVLLAKINIDENQQIATQLRIKSIPTVLAFKKKQIVNAFNGVLPEKKIIEFIEKVLGESLEKDNSSFFVKIKELIENSKLSEAEQLLEEYLSENSKDVKAIGLYLNCMINLSKFQETKDFISDLSKEILSKPELKSVITNLEIMENNSKSPTLEEIIIKYNKDPNNLNFVIKLSEKYFVNDKIENSFNLLIDQYQKNNERNKEKIKKILLKYFDALGNENENTKYFRKKFSSIMFS